MTKVSSSSPRKADANRRNAKKSTGPRTARGKSWARLNAMKHGILASQAVIAAMEGYHERKLFEATVEGLERDFEPVGTYEQLLVQEIAACFWRKRRLLMFENRAAFDALDQPAKQVINDAEKLHTVMRPSVYLHNGKLVTPDYVYDAAGLDRATLPSEADTMRVIRYEATINRTRERAVAALREMRKARKGTQAAREATPPAIDRGSMQRNRQRSTPVLVSPIIAAGVYAKFDAIALEARMAEEAEAEQNDQTKPKKVITDEQIAEMRRILYRDITGNEMPEETVEAPTEASGTTPADADKPPEG